MGSESNCKEPNMPARVICMNNKRAVVWYQVGLTTEARDKSPAGPGVGFTYLPRQSEGPGCTKTTRVANGLPLYCKGACEQVCTGVANYHQPVQMYYNDISCTQHAET